MKTGQVLAKLREEAGMSQKQVSKKMGVSASTVQRMETEASGLMGAEVNNFLKALSTENAKEAQAYFRQTWKKLSKPTFFHPSRKYLWQAELSLNKIDELQKGIDPNSVFFKQLELHRQTLINLADYLESTEHTIAWIGSIGVGKTTAICGALNLIHDEKPVLHTGGGRSTVCEVLIKQGPEYGIKIDPLSEDEIYKFIYDFSDYLLAITSKKSDNAKYLNAESFTLSKEIERCIRNLADLPIHRFKSEEGFKQEDEAINIVNGLKESHNLTDEDLSDDLKIQLIMRLNLDSRKATELWYPNDIKDEPLKWLREIYRKINHGQHPDFTIPRRITINVPFSLLTDGSLKLNIIDTKGVDDTAKREDLEIHLSDPRALTIFCSRFLDAPDETTRTLIERARDAGIKDRLSNETAILVLPRNEEAITVNTLDGTPIQEREEGYMVRSDDIQSDLMKYDLRNLPVWFFDAKKESPSETRNFIIKRIMALRTYYENRIIDVRKTIDKVSENIQDAKAQAAFSAVLHSIDAWIKEHKVLSPIGKIQTSLIDTIEDKRTYAASVRACVNRLGSWYNLDYYYQIGFGTRTETVKTISEMLSELNTIIKNLQAQDDLKPAHEFLSELQHFCDSESEYLYQEIQRYGQEIYKKKLYESKPLWAYLQDQWGRGAGYKIRISKKTEEWFTDEEQERIHNNVMGTLVESWNKMINKFEDLVHGVFEE